MQGLVLALVLLVGPLVVMTVGGLLFARKTRDLVKPGHACKHCGYDLRSLGDAARCPECGSADGPALVGSARGMDVIEVCLLTMVLCAVVNWAVWGLDRDWWWMTLLVGPLWVLPGMITFAAVAAIRVSERTVPRVVVWVWGIASGVGCAAMPVIADFLAQRGEGGVILVAPLVVHYVSVPFGLVGLAVARQFVRHAQA
ncbi:MAG TPA: hypothetical protein VK157_08770 [Phycisphaerales bacterium]|nr:hypothetical protein [Phycisphaerales bacterium]